MLQRVGYTGKFLRKNAHLADLIEKTLTAMGHELVEVECASARLLRVYIDQAEDGIVIEDCEKVSRQLTRAFEAGNVSYGRLKVPSSGLDHPLHTLADFTYSAGLEAKVTLRLPANGQKNFTGVIQALTDEPDQERIGFESEGKEGPTLLGFTLSELDRARLAPVLDFKGNRNKENKQ